MNASCLHTFFFLAGLVFFAATSLAGQSGRVHPVPFGQGMIIVEDLAAEYHPGSGTVTVTAKIKNMSQSMLKGYATIYLLSAEGKKIHAYQEEVNDGEIFAHGTTVEFKATSKLTDISKVSSISVDFTQS